MCYRALAVIIFQLEKAHEYVQIHQSLYVQIEYLQTSSNLANIYLCFTISSTIAMILFQV